MEKDGLGSRYAPAQRGRAGKDGPIAIIAGSCNSIAASTLQRIPHQK